MLRIRRPLCFMAVSYALGLLAGAYFDFDMRWWIVLLVVLLADALYAIVQRKSSVFIVLTLVFFMTGGLRMHVEKEKEYFGYEEPLAVEARVLACTDINLEEKFATLVIGDIHTAQGEAIIPGKKVQLYIRVEEDHLPGGGGEIFLEHVKLSALRGKRNPGGFDQEGYYRSRGIVLSASAGDAWTYQAPEGVNIWSALYHAQEAVGSKIDKLFIYMAPVYRGMLLGDKRGIDQAVYADLRRSGTAHLLAVSGLHVSALLGLALYLAGKRQLSLRVSTALLLLLAWGYGLLTGLSASTLRACMMGSLLIIARMLHERYDAPAALAAVFLVLTLRNPFYIKDMGFMLSYATVGGILLLLPTVQRAFKRLPSRLGGVISISLSAQFACLPLQIAYFGEISLIGLGMNCLCIPFATVLVVGGMILVALSFPFPLIGALFAPAFRVSAALMQGIMQWASNIPFATLRVATPPVMLIIAYYAICFWISPYFDRPPRIRFTCIGTLSGGCAAFLIAGYLSPAFTQYVTLDVGQGDCAVLRSEEGAVCVIDTGPLHNTELVGYLHHEGISVDLLVLTHLDSDHAGGICALEQARIPIEHILVPYGADIHNAEAAIVHSIASLVARGSTLSGCGYGDKLSLPGINIEALGPKNTMRGDNARSLVLRLQTQGVVILSMGDVPQDAEPLRNVRCDVLKVAHHGSAGSSSELFIDLARPSLALISVGNNAFGHPSDQVIKRLEYAGVRLLRTDACGAITLTLKEGQYSVETMIK